MTKYVTDTGPGYCSVAKVSPTMTLSYGVSTLPVDWGEDTDVYVFVEDGGRSVALVESGSLPDGADVVTTHNPYRFPGKGTNLSLSAKTLEPLGVGPGDDVRLYERDGGGLCVVASDDDPFLDG